MDKMPLFSRQEPVRLASEVEAREEKLLDILKNGLEIEEPGHSLIVRIVSDSAGKRVEEFLANEGFIVKYVRELADMDQDCRETFFSNKAQSLVGLTRPHTDVLNVAQHKNRFALILSPALYHEIRTSNTVSLQTLSQGWEIASQYCWSLVGEES